MRLQLYSRNWGTFQAPQGSRVKVRGSRVKGQGSRFKQEIQSSLGKNTFLSETQLMSHTQSQNPFLSQTQLMSHIQSSVGQTPFLSQTQLMSHKQSHYFSKRHVTYRHDQTSFGWFLSRMGKSDDSRGGSQYTIYILLSSNHMLHPMVSIMYVSILSCYWLGHVCYIVAYVCLKEVPIVRLMFLMFLVRTRNLCMNQNAYKTSGTERESISFKLAHTTISNGHK